MKQREFTTLEDRLLKLVRETKHTREELNIVPTYTLRTQVSISFGKSRKEIERAARSLEQKGLIRIGDTICDKYYELIEQNEIEVPPRL